MTSENGTMTSWGADGVVVGVDGSPESLSAVDLAAHEAALRGQPLHIVHGYLPSYLYAPPVPSPIGPSENDLRRQADRLVADTITRARELAPDVEVTGEVVIGSATDALITRSRTASLVVVGDRGLGAFTGLLVGSVAIHLASHATCPVLVARGTADAALPILLAADGSPANEPAVQFAFAEAALRGSPLLALHAWTHPASTGPGDMQPLVFDQAAVDAEETRLLAEALAGAQEAYPEVVVHRRVVYGHVRRTIIDATREAQLVVVGTRGHGGFAGLLLGSVSQAVLHHAACPTAIVPHVHQHEAPGD